MLAPALAATLATGTLLSAPAAYAQDPSPQDLASAREIGKQAVSDYKDGKYSEALDGFTRAHQLVHLSTTGLWRARSLAHLGRLVEASEQYLEVRRMKLDDKASDTHRKALDEAAAERKALLKRIPRLTIDVGGPLPDDVTVTLDGAPVSAALVGAPQLVDPGKHAVVIRRGEADKSYDIELAEKQNERLKAELPPAPTKTPTPVLAPGPTPTPTPTPTPEPGGEEAGGSVLGPVGWTLVGLGGAGLIAGAVTGGLALDRNSTLEAGCTNMQCPPDLHDDVDSFNLLRTMSTATFIAGGVLAATGLTLVIVDATTGGEETAETPPPSAQLKLRAGPTGVTLLGTF